MILTLLTDFGLQDPYVAVMKGVMLQINPHLSLIDLTHQIPPQNVAMARFNLMMAVPYFAADTVHLGVVDPGVGGQRRAIAVSFAGGFLVGPDNGLFSGVLSQTSAIAAVELTQSQYWRTPNPSKTFHGRDIFAPVAAHLASGIPLTDLGTPIDPQGLVQLAIPPLTQEVNIVRGSVQAIDTFGNVITNIPATALTMANSVIQVEQTQLSLRQTYSDAPPGTLIALMGSHGWLEIAVVNGSACDRLQIETGHEVIVSHAPRPTDEPLFG
ncbi:MAG: SAM-dependent chlorinase/fluorinase [Leptolyngbyaceae cyanobacterium bins.59]|nr:SAM-dependent chlorinase/fluorinase [Leptolyngbyaceae cyanobacterium bins.59]